MYVTRAGTGSLDRKVRRGRRRERRERRGRRREKGRRRRRRKPRECSRVGAACRPTRDCLFGLGIGWRGRPGGQGGDR